MKRKGGKGQKPTPKKKVDQTTFLERMRQAIEPQGDPLRNFIFFTVMENTDPFYNRVGDILVARQYSKIKLLVEIVRIYGGFNDKYAELIELEKKRLRKFKHLNRLGRSEEIKGVWGEE